MLIFLEMLTEKTKKIRLKYIYHCIIDHNHFAFCVLALSHWFRKPQLPILVVTFYELV